MSLLISGTGCPWIRQRPIQSDFSFPFLLSLLGTQSTLPDRPDGRPWRTFGSLRFARAEGNIVGRNLSDELGRRQVKEVVPADIIDWDYRFAAVLRQQQECRVHRASLPMVLVSFEEQ